MKGKPDDLERVRHMLEAIDKIERFTDDMDYAAFLANEMAQYAVIKNFEILGEAAYQLSRVLKEKYPDIEWSKIEGMRHILVHEYYRINSELLWNTKEERLTDLRIQMEELLSAEETQTDRG
jgi:uncharacterized protein with HEPN domain